jgi:hypothetical protein
VDDNNESRHQKAYKGLPTDMKQTLDTFELLLGDNLDGRKSFIAEKAGVISSWRIFRRAEFLSLT